MVKVGQPQTLKPVVRMEENPTPTRKLMNLPDRYYPFENQPDEICTFIEPITGVRVTTWSRTMILATMHFNRNYILRGMYGTLGDFLEILGAGSDQETESIGWCGVDECTQWIDFYFVELPERDINGYRQFMIGYSIDPSKEGLEGELELSANETVLESERDDQDVVWLRANLSELERHIDTRSVIFGMLSSGKTVSVADALRMFGTLEKHIDMKHEYWNVVKNKECAEPIVFTVYSGYVGISIKGVELDKEKKRAAEFGMNPPEDTYETEEVDDWVKRVETKVTADGNFFKFWCDMSYLKTLHKYQEDVFKKIRNNGEELGSYSIDMETMKEIFNLSHYINEMDDYMEAKWPDDDMIINMYPEGDDMVVELHAIHDVLPFK